jgi:hypothetical protein
LASRVDLNINYSLEILTLRAVDRYINESILRGPLEGGHLGGAQKFGGGLQKFSLPANNEYTFGFQLDPFDLHPCWVIRLKGGVWVPGHRNALP